MNTLIICFSQSGNTHGIAKEIQVGIRDSQCTCDLMEMKNVSPAETAKYDLVGLGCPVFYFKEPFNVAEFIESLPELANKQWFIFCTHGAVMGETLVSMSERLTRKKIMVIGSHDSYADSRVPFYPHPTLTTGHPDEQDYAEAREFGREIVACSRAVAAGDPSRIQPLPPVVEEWVPEQAALLTQAFMEQVFPRLHIDDDGCIGCGECEERCPVNGIKVEAVPREIQTDCIYCWDCVKNCPTESITADWSGMAAIAVEMFKKYRVSADTAQAKGEFRYLIDPDMIDFSNLLYQQK